MVFPEFHKFYEIMLGLYKHYYDLNASSKAMGYLCYLFNRMFDSRYGNEPKLSPAFEYVWSMFCSPSSYLFHALRCTNCEKEWDIVTKNKPTNLNYFDGSRAMEPMELHFHTVLCPKCGYTLGRSPHEIVGIFKHKKITKQESNDPDFIRQYLEERGNDIR